MPRDSKANVPDAQDFGVVLRSIRIERGLSQEELAFRSGYHQTYVSQLERGRKSPTLIAVFHFAEALGVPATDIVAAVQERHTSNKDDGTLR